MVGAASRCSARRPLTTNNTTKPRRFAREPKPRNNVDAAEVEAAPAPKPERKISAVTRLLTRVGGATLDDLVVATGWLPHTTRAALTGLRKKGHTIVRDKVEGVAAHTPLAVLP